MSVKSSLMVLGIILSVFLFSGCATHEITAESPEPESGEEDAWYTPVVDKAELHQRHGRYPECGEHGEGICSAGGGDLGPHPGELPR